MINHPIYKGHFDDYISGNIVKCHLKSKYAIIKYKDLDLEIYGPSK